MSSRARFVLGYVFADFIQDRTQQCGRLGIEHRIDLPKAGKTELYESEQIFRIHVC